MKLILTHEVTGLGEPGDVVTVKDGYGRNYLLPRNLAMPWTKGGQKQVDQIRAARTTRAVKTLDDAKGIKGQLEAKTFRIKAHAGTSGRLFGALSPSDIADVAKEEGISIDRRKVEFTSPIKTTGDAKVTVRLHPEVLAVMKLNVVAG